MQIPPSVISLFQVGRDYNIPRDVDTQAQFWVDYIRPTGVLQDYIDGANTLQESMRHFRPSAHNASRKRDLKQ